jgi:hypothetical protein
MRRKPQYQSGEEEEEIVANRHYFWLAGATDDSHLLRLPPVNFNSRSRAQKKEAKW